MRLNFCADETLHITSWNKNIEEFTGRPTSEVIGQKYYNVLPRIYVNDTDALLFSLSQNEDLFLKDFPLNSLTCSVRADVSIKMLNGAGDNGEKVKVMLSPYSGCRAKQIIHESQRYIDIGKIASTLAHGVRNPLNALKGSVVFLEDKFKHDETLNEFSAIMAEEIERLDYFISRFLSSSITEPDLSKTDINTIIKKIEIMTSLQTRALDIVSSYEYGRVPSIIVNSFQIEQAILNIINNAIEAMKSGGYMKVKTFTKEIDHSSFIVIEITDSGPGFPARNADTMSFHQSNSDRGFGVVLAREILRNHHGNIEIKSEKDIGSQIRLLLPCKRRKTNEHVR